MVVDVVNFILVSEYDTQLMARAHIRSVVVLFYLVTFKPTQGQVENEHRNILVSSVKWMSVTMKMLFYALNVMSAWSHACLGMSKTGFKYYLDNPELDWTFSLCSLPFRTVDNMMLLLVLLLVSITMNWVLSRQWNIHEHGWW